MFKERYFLFKRNNITEVIWNNLTKCFWSGWTCKKNVLYKTEKQEFTISFVLKEMCIERCFLIKKKKREFTISFVLEEMCVARKIFSH